jgi:hypothetical protein
MISRDYAKFAYDEQLFSDFMSKNEENMKILENRSLEQIR